MIRVVVVLFCFSCGFLLENLYAKDDLMNTNTSRYEEAIFAMGCFWCGESEFREHDDPSKLLEGVISIRVGYAGGTAPNPTYQNHHGYKEAVKVVYDPSLITYEDLLAIFWRNIDPLDGRGQFCDQGFPYTSVIFYKDDGQEELALRRKEQAEQELGGKRIVTEIIPFTTFYDAEEYHQNFKLKNPLRYKFYRWNCGRDQRLRELWRK